MNYASKLQDWGDGAFGFEQQFSVAEPGKPSTHALVRFFPHPTHVEVSFGSTVHYGAGVLHRADASLVLSPDQAHELGAALRPELFKLLREMPDPVRGDERDLRAWARVLRRWVEGA